MDGSSSFRILISLKLEGEGGGIAAVGEALTVAESSGCGWLVGSKMSNQKRVKKCLAYFHFYWMGINE